MTVNDIAVLWFVFALAISIIGFIWSRQGKLVIFTDKTDIALTGAIFILPVVAFVIFSLFGGSCITSIIKAIAVLVLFLAPLAYSFYTSYISNNSYMPAAIVSFITKITIMTVIIAVLLLILIIMSAATEKPEHKKPQYSY